MTFEDARYSIGGGVLVGGVFGAIGFWGFQGALVALAIGAIGWGRTFHRRWFRDTRLDAVTRTYNDVMKDQYQKRLDADPDLARDALIYGRLDADVEE